MTPVLFILICLAGGVGAALRHLADILLSPIGSGRFPVGILLINATGSLGLGVVTALAAATVLDESSALVLGVGLLGGYTTFSTVSVGTVRMIREGRVLAAAANSLGMLALCVGLAAAGYIGTGAIVIGLSAG
jgi:CrcB protein